MIKCIVFDWYGVCAFEPFIYIFSRELEAKLNIPKDQTSIAFKKHLKKYVTDNITGEEFLELVFTDLGLSNWSNFFYLFDRHADVNWEVMNLVKKLRATHQTILFSDSFNGPYEKYDSQVGGMENFFDKIILSHKLKIHKEESKMYQHLVDQSGVKPEEMVFIDDWEKNLKIAKQFGIEGILFKSYPDLLDQFSNLKII